jgi:prepilin-type N-terminal cleavage/methylation domain-containing protein
MRSVRTSIRSRKGFSAVELLTAILIIAVLVTTATPAVLQWRQGLEVKKTTRQIASVLRQARSAAVNRNLEQQVQFDSVLQRYGLSEGNLAYNSTAFVPVVNWNTLNLETPVNPGAVGTTTICFNPNGTSTNCATVASSATITVQDKKGSTKIAVTVSPTGFIRIR